MIPKRIFYTWFGGKPLPDFEKHCIESWKKCCPDYEIVRIDETNFDYENYNYANVAYKKGIWSYVSDLARYWALSQNGGIYLDTDTMLLRPLDDLLHYDAVFVQNRLWPFTTPLMCSEKAIPIFQELFDRLNKLVDGDKLLGNGINAICDFWHEKWNILPVRKQVIEENICFLEQSYFANQGASCPGGYGIHCARGSWLGCGCTFFDYLGFDVYVNGVFDADSTRKLTGRKIGKMEISDQSFDDSLAKYTNYFFNNTVAKVETRNVKLTRYGIDEKDIRSVYEDNGAIVSCL